MYKFLKDYANKRKGQVSSLDPSLADSLIKKKIVDPQEGFVPRRYNGSIRVEFLEDFSNKKKGDKASLSDSLYGSLFNRGIVKRLGFDDKPNESKNVKNKANKIS